MFWVQQSLWIVLAVPAAVGLFWKCLKPQEWSFDPLMVVMLVVVT